MTEEKRSIKEIDVSWGTLPPLKQLGVTMEVKALLNNNLSDHKDSVPLKKHMLAMALYSNPDDFFEELERLILLMVAPDRAKIHYLMGELMQATTDAAFPKETPPEVYEAAEQPSEGYVAEMADYDFQAPYDGDLSKASDEEIDAYLARMSANLSESPHYGETQRYFNNLADS